MKELQDRWCVEHRNEQGSEYEPRGRVGGQTPGGVFEHTIEMKPVAKRFSKRFEDEIKYFNECPKRAHPPAEKPSEHYGKNQYACRWGKVLPLELEMGEQDERICLEKRVFPGPEGICRPNEYEQKEAEEERL